MENLQRTLVLIKPDGVQRNLIGEIIKRFEQRGFKIAALKMVWVNKEFAAKHYPMTEKWIKGLASKTREAYEKRGENLDESDNEIAGKVHNWLKDYLTEGPVVAMVIEGYHVVEIVRKMIGHTESRQAAPGTIRGDFSVESYQLADNKQRPIRNIVHASGSKEEAETEIALWFTREEIHDYEKKDWEVIHK